MLPSFEPNQYVVCWRWPGTRFRVGDVVVVRHPAYDLIIKRVLQTDSTRGYLLRGDNSASTSTEALGWVKKAEILGRVIYRVK